jgi:hypothetical protein
MIKTVLVPGAPWPVHALEVPLPEKPKFKHQSKPIRKIEAKPRSKIKRTNDNFDAWLASEQAKKAKP